MERVLRSVAGVAEEVIVADTGSTDGTAEAAASLGAKVTTLAWEDDFAAARNQALAGATGDWVLWLNPDEEILPAGRERLPAYLAREDTLAYFVRVLEQSQADRPDYVAETLQPRLFRRAAGVRFQGRLHPAFAEPLEELARRQGKLVGAADVTLRRHAYLSVPTPEKLRWAARLLELELRDRPGQIHYLVQYGRTLLLLNDPRGHEVLAEAVEQILPARDAPVPPAPATAPLLEYLLTVVPQQCRAQLSRAEARQLALRWFRQTPPVVWALAQDYFQAGEYASAAGLLQDLLRMGRTGAYDHSDAFQPDVIGPAALLNLGACYTRLGDLDQAESCFRQLLTDPARQAQARRNLTLVQTRRGRH
jgi:tetratricopeptide (TPR) repeat protein